MLYAAIDIHKHAFQAAVFDSGTGEVVGRRFSADRGSLGGWAEEWRGRVEAVARSNGPPASHLAPHGGGRRRGLVHTWSALACAIIASAKAAHVDRRVPLDEPIQAVITRGRRADRAARDRARRVARI
jgi:hypothetical protein